MSGRRSRLIALATVPAAVALLLTGCANRPTTDPSSSSSPTAATKELPVAIADGTITPNAERVEVEVGTIVKVNVTSDVEDELHVHGYDKTLAIVPSRPRSLTFLADQTGRFEIELHHADKLLYQLVVNP